MRKERFLFILLCLILIFAFTQAGLQAGKGRLQVSETSWDWGRAPQNASLSHSFWLKNVGTDTLKGIAVTVA